MYDDDLQQPSSGHKKRKFGIGSSAILAIIIAITVTVWLASGVMTDEPPPQAGEIASPQEKGQEAAQSKTSVRVATVQAKDMEHTVKVNGLTQASRSVNLTSEINGKIATIHAEEGTVVKKGAKIISITTEDRSSLVNRAERTVEQRRIEFQSAEELHKKGFVSDARLAEARAALNEAEADLERARVNLSNTVISAPFTGILEENHIEIGDVVAPGTTVATFLDLMPAEFVAYISEKNIRAISTGTSAHAVLVDGTEIPLTVSYVAAQADPDTRTFQVKLSYPNDNMDVVAGMTTRIILPVGSTKAHFIPPSILTLNEDGQVGVKSVDEKNTVVFHPIEILQSTNAGIWVGGLPDSINLIVVGQEYVAVGETVKTQPAEQAFLPLSGSKEN